MLPDAVPPHLRFGTTSRLTLFPLYRRQLPGPSRPILLLISLAALLISPLLHAQPDSLSTPTWRSDLPLAEPIVEADAQFHAQRAQTWTHQNLHWLLLENQVTIRIGAYGFQADRAVVRIQTESQPGRLIRHLAMYLDQARHLKGAGPIAAEAPRLLVTAATTGRIELVVDLLNPPDASDHPLVLEAHQRIQRYLAAISRPLLPVPPGPPLISSQALALKEIRRQEAQQQLPPGTLQPPPPSVPPPPPAPPPAGPTPTPPAVQPEQAIIAPTGYLFFNAQRWVFQELSDQETALALMGQVQVFYQSLDGQQNISVQAENAVLFLAGSARQLAARQVNAADVRGIYLEDNAIVSDGRITLRAPRMYFDLAQNKAVLLEAVLYAWDPRHHIPIYLRAAQLRQESRTSFSAHRALLTTTEFAEPHFAIASDRLTLTQTPQPDGSTAYRFEAENSHLRFAYLPIAPLPRVSGEPGQTPLRRVRAGYSSQSGPTFATTWDLFALSGRTAPSGVDLSAQVDWLGDHGGALGLNLDYDRPRMFGRFDSYLLPADSAEDKIGDRLKIEHDLDTRGFFHWQHRQEVIDGWEVSLEASYISDETFLEEFFPDKASAQRPPETSAYLKKQQDDWAFTLLAHYDLQDTVFNLAQLQSPGYKVDRLPELGYWRIGTSLWENRLSYFTENRLSRLRLRTGHDSPADRGFTDALSQQFFGIPLASTHFDDVLAASLPTDWLWRLDSRHELNLPMKAGPLDLTPYLAGRLTFYDQDFDAFGMSDDQTRFLGQLGVRAHTQFWRHYNVDLPLLDIHQLRHIIEPSLDIFHIASTTEPSDLPIFDPDVENLTEGFGIRLGLRNTLQTLRGGPNAWQSTDLLILDTDLIHRSSDADADDPLPRYFSYRPEYSLGGDHLFLRLLANLTDSLALASELTQNLDTGQAAQWRIALHLDQTPRLRHTISYTDLDVLSERLLSYSLLYQLTRTYAFSLTYTYDVQRDESRLLTASLERKIPGWRFLILARHDLVEDENFFGVQLVPEGMSSSALLTPPGPSPD